MHVRGILSFCMSASVAAAPALREQLAALHGESFAWAVVCWGRDEAGAEDVLQVTYLKILQGRACFDGRSAFKTWLFGVIRLTAWEERRRAWWWGRRRAPEEAAWDHASDGAAPDDAAGRGEVRARVRAACAELPQRQRQTLLLVFHHELSLDEAAKVMGISPGSARKHYQRGKEQLRRELSNLLE